MFRMNEYINKIFGNSNSIYYYVYVYCDTTVYECVPCVVLNMWGEKSLNNKLFVNSG